ncbi:MAG: 2'-5' RNA ligase family protein [Candidatus Obscuribacterales bacterium]|nr:2'-5' RNA ligase family protein [Candidatus Obscuribacterales bacterium]
MGQTNNESYLPKVGVGILYPTNFYNQARKLQLQIAQSTSNCDGLTQSPHVTIKRPFRVDNMVGALDAIREVLSNQKAITLSANGLGSFPTGAVFLKINPTDELNMLHHKLLSILKPFGVEPDQFEGANMLFHTSLALNLKGEQLSQTLDLLHGMEELLRFELSSPDFGLFYELSHNRGWSIGEKISSHT